MENKARQALYRFRKKHGLCLVWLPKADLKAIINMYLMMKKGELPKELVAYLKEQRG
jgi:23S rRNA A2030 N6-methylase RlmJ